MKHYIKLIGVTIFLVLTILLSACGQVAVPNASAQPAIPPTIPVEGTVAPTVEIIATPTLVLFGDVVEAAYPYYRPLAIVPEIAPQTIGNVTATIDWTYVDESRVALHYTISDLDWPDGAMMDAMSMNVTSPNIPNIGYGGSSGNSMPADKGAITGSMTCYSSMVPFKQMNTRRLV